MRRIANKWTKNPVVISFSGESDDGGWSHQQYSMKRKIDDEAWTPYGDSWPSRNLGDGDHTIRVKIRDVCGHESERERSAVIAIDSRPPTVSFKSPTSGSRIRRNSSFTVQIIVGDPFPGGPLARGGSSGIGKVELFLDDFPSEFGEGKDLGDFEGSFAVGLANTKSKSVDTDDWSIGSHTLIVQAVDKAGNKASARRRILCIR
jgi:hypothetical protein